jgi:excisionase family DNA binding protein
MTTNPNELLDEHAVAELLGISIKTLQKWRCNSNGPSYVKVGRLVRYRRSAIEKWIERQTQAA